MKLAGYGRFAALRRTLFAGCGRYAASLVLVGCATPARPPAWEQPLPRITDLPVVAAGVVQRSKLNNGLTVVALEDHRLPRVVLGVSFRRGAASVDLSEAGLAHFASDLMKRGAGDRDAQALATAIDEIGGSLGVFSGWDSITAQVTGLSRDLDRLSKILSDVVLRPRFDESEAARARGEIMAALERAKDNPAALAGRAAMRTLYPGQRLGIPLNGTPETVGPLDSAAARGFHERMMIPNNAVFYASGDIDPEDVFARVQAAFGDWRAAPIPDPGPPRASPVPKTRRIVVVDRPDLVQARILLVHEGISRTNPDRIAAGLMNSVIGSGGFSSRLMARLRAEAGLTYHVNSSFNMHRDGGTFSISTYTQVPQVRRVIDLVLAELDRARTQPPSEAELAQARAMTVGGFFLALETSDAVLGALVNLDIYGLPEDSLETFRPRVWSTSVSEVARMATGLLHPGRAAIILVGPAEALVSQLQGLGPVEVVDPRSFATAGRRARPTGTRRLRSTGCRADF